MRLVCSHTTHCCSFFYFGCIKDRPGRWSYRHKKVRSLYRLIRGHRSDDLRPIFLKFFLHGRRKCLCTLWIHVKHPDFLQFSYCQHCLQLGCRLSACTNQCPNTTVFLRQQVKSCSRSCSCPNLGHIGSIQYCLYNPILPVDHKYLGRGCRKPLVNIVWENIDDF